MKKVSGRTRVVGNWQPTKLDREVIAVEFPAILRKIFGDYSCELAHPSDFRNPNFNAYSEIECFHQDCGNPYQYLVVWSNVSPTEVIFIKTGRMLKTHDGDIILLNNKEVKHRAPANRTNRWFARIRNIKQRRPSQ